MFYILFGEDDFSLKEALTKIKEGLGDEAMVATNTTVLQGQNTTPEQVIATCDTVPFLATKRLVIVEGLLGLFEQRDKVKHAPKHKDSGWLSLKGYVERMPESTVLVLIDGKLKKSNPLLKELAPQATVKEFKPPFIPPKGIGKGDQLYNWMQTRANKSGGSISPAAGRLLANLIGSNLWLLSSEIDKLCLYTLGRTIEENDVELLVAEAREFTVFAMIDAILEHRSAAATKLLHRLEVGGAAPPYLLFMITRQFRLVIQAKHLLHQRRRAAEMGHSLGLTSEYALQKTIAQAKVHSMKRLENIYRNLLDTDISIKTGRFKGDKGELALDLLIGELCAEPS
ncbi:MAG: DNA polymerase III subunit delta [Dehalococcoidia bacterium]